MTPRASGARQPGSLLMGTVDYNKVNYSSARRHKHTYRNMYRIQTDRDSKKGTEVYKYTV